MGYVATSWLESGMTTQEKVDGLTNLETIYAESISYIDTITHGERYYTKAETAAKYFTSATDGTGTGLICETLDGYTAQQIIDAGIPSGSIGWWSGSEASIPDGFFLCNGLNSTPNLLDRFVPGAGSTYSKGDVGGSDTATPTASSVSIGTHAITVDELPSHRHSYTEYYNATYYGTPGGYLPPSAHDSTTTMGTSTAHGHSGSTFTGSDTDVRPAFYALCFIMKGFQ